MGTSLRRRFRLLWFGLRTLLGLGARGYFIPYRYAHTIPAGSGPACALALEPFFKARKPAFLDFIEKLEGYAPVLKSLSEGDGPKPRWDQDWFPRLDGAAAYVMARENRPARIVEIGGGHSTRFLARAVADGGFPCAVTVVEPAPRRALLALERTGAISIVRDVVQSYDCRVFETLAPGDIFSLDGSHLLMPGSDVDVVLNRVLPFLPAGVLVHIHDIFLPDPYPEDWAWRGYNEQGAVAPLLWGGGFDMLFSSRYAATRLGPRLATSPLSALPLNPGVFETGLWLRRRDAQMDAGRH